MAARRRRRKAAQGIRSVSVGGFKSLNKEQRITVRPLTLIAGANSSGKSSILQPLLLLKQTLEAPYDPGPLLLDGPNVSITKIEQVLSRNQRTTPRTFTVGFSLEDKPEVRLRFGRSRSGDIRLIDLRTILDSNLDDQPILITEGMTEDELIRSLPPRLLRQVESFTEPELGSRGLHVQRNRWMLEVWQDVGPRSNLRGLRLSIGPELEDYETEIGRIIHLPALRGNPRRTYRTAAVEDRYPGTFNDYTAGIIAAWQNRSEDEKLQQLRSDLSHLGLTSAVVAHQLDDTSVELLVGRLPHDTKPSGRNLVNIADVGFGVSQTLPVLVGLIAAIPGQLVYLEQPEIHLHPRAQAAFADLLVAAVARGAKVIVETHSALLLRAVQTRVAQDRLSSEDVALHWFNRNEFSGETTVSTAQLDRFGSFGDWPEDFDEVVLKTDHDYLTASEAAEAAQ